MSSTESSSRPVRGIPALVATIVGVVVMAWSFVTGISAALDGGGSGAFAYEVIFIAAAALVLVGLVIGIINLVRGRSRAIAILTIIIAIVPVVGVVVLRFAALG
jgi:hypothetical protein